MYKKEYGRPELTVMSFSLRDVIMASPEYYSSYLDDSNDDWGDPSLPDSDEQIDW